MSKICAACGMPMEKKEDFAMGNPDKDYCSNCCRQDGSMQNYEEKLNSLVKFIVKTQGIDNAAARNLAADMMAKLPAWSKKSKEDQPWKRAKTRK